MDAQELRQFTAEELTSRVKQWREELFRARLKRYTTEMKDTSIFKKLRKDIARGLMVLGEKNRELQAKPADKVAASAPQAKDQATDAKGASK